MIRICSVYIPRNVALQELQIIQGREFISEMVSKKKFVMKSGIIKFSIFHTETIRKLPQPDVLTSHFSNGCVIKPFCLPFYEQFFATLKRYSIYIAIRIVRPLFLMIRV